MSAAETPRAFPSNVIDDRFAGMSLRDWFAAFALTGDLASYAGVIEGLPSAEAVARRAYGHADAMIAVRKNSDISRAAPDLLAALERIMNSDSAIPPSLIGEAQAAIAKAKGDA